MGRRSRSRAMLLKTATGAVFSFQWSNSRKQTRLRQGSNRVNSTLGSAVYRPLVILKYYIIWTINPSYNSDAAFASFQAGGTRSNFGEAKALKFPE
jgi:hypothetical protein